MLDLDLVQKNLDSVKNVYKKLNKKYELYNRYKEEITEQGAIAIYFNDLFVTKEEAITNKLLNIKKEYHYNDIHIFIYTLAASKNNDFVPIYFNYNIIEYKTRKIIMSNNCNYNYKDIDDIISFIDKIKNISMNTFVANCDIKKIVLEYIENYKLTEIRKNKLLRYFKKCNDNLSIYNLNDITKNIPINYSMKYDITNKLIYALRAEIDTKLNILNT